MTFYIVLNEEALPEPYETEAEARREAQRLVREYEAEHGRKASWVIMPEPKPH